MHKEFNKTLTPDILINKDKRGSLNQSAINGEPIHNIQYANQHIKIECC